MNKKVLITGASRGIGEAIARKLAMEHYDLYLTCLHSEDKLRSLATYLEQEYNVSVGAFLCDMSSYKEVDRLFRHIPSLDILINNAGISYIGLLSEMSPESWQKVLDTNLSSLFYTSRKAIPLMLQKHRGQIINISSVWGAALLWKLPTPLPKAASTALQRLWQRNLPPPASRSTPSPAGSFIRK